MTMGLRQVWNDEAIISDALGRAPDIQLSGAREGWCLSRWRQFVGHYKLPALPDPIFVVHIAGKPRVRTWERHGWSEESSFPGCVTIVPSGQPTGWLVDGELDVVTLSLEANSLKSSPAAERFRRMHFAFSDPLGLSLTRRVLSELYKPRSAERDVYISVLMNALKHHTLRGVESQDDVDIPLSDNFAFRVHQMMNSILHHPEQSYSIETMAAQVGVSPTHFCRIFKKASGQSPHQFVMRAKFDRASQLLTQSNTQLSAIADLLGFTSQSHFTRAFRRYTGKTPSQVRRLQTDG
jgi:AraC family transcriptional regulator